MKMNMTIKYFFIHGILPIFITAFAFIFIYIVDEINRKIIKYYMMKKAEKREKRKL